ncbi:MAG: phage coat protein [Burkholderiales bacterium]|nr:phage coat protein [Burkholderiales bacterium]
MKALRNNARRLGLGVSAAMLPVLSHAQSTGIDVSGVVSGIGDAQAPIVAIGSAVLLVLVAVAVFKWIRRAM